jgi:hypothetical protein
MICDRLILRILAAFSSFFVADRKGPARAQPSADLEASDLLFTNTRMAAAM